MNQQRSAHLITGLSNVLVDGFRLKMGAIADPRDRVYILSHFHSDHYGGLTNTWNQGMIYCTPITGRLVKHVLKVDPSLVVEVDYNATINLPGFELTFLDANHCPGAALILFQLINGKCHLHTGDMRYDAKMKSYEILNQTIDTLYLDTTYAHVKNQFISQDDAIMKIVDLTSSFFQSDAAPGLVLLSAYTIGKERIFLKLVAQGYNIYMDEDKLAMMRLLGGEFAEMVDAGRFTSDRQAATIHVCRMGFVVRVQIAIQIHITVDDFQFLIQSFEMLM